MDSDLLYMNMSAVAVFRGVLERDVINRLMALLKSASPSDCGAFAKELYRTGSDLSEYILNAVCEDENICLLSAARGEELSPLLWETAQRELKIFEEASLNVTPEYIRSITGFEGYLPSWTNSACDFIAAYKERLASVRRTGYGIYARYLSFMLRSGKITPVITPDPQRLYSLSGYENERKKIIDNTLALINGRPAANVLLYGDAGTGKSSTVKAVVNEFGDRGLRLIELKKSQLHELPEVMSEISSNPLKFIIFIDDLSFGRDDDDFGALKAVLEGSAASKAPNSVIYATSNRVHLVKESFSDRYGDDVHAEDTREELSSLSERFGLKVTFVKPSKDIYLKIVESLAEQSGIEYSRDKLFAEAEAFALRKSGRSGRAARQFVDMLRSREMQ